MAHLPAQRAAGVSLKNSRGANTRERREMLAGSTGLEPAASGVTGRRSNQLNYDPKTNFANLEPQIANWVVRPIAGRICVSKSAITNQLAICSRPTAIRNCLVGGTGFEPVTAGV